MSKDTEKAFVILYCEYKRLRKAGYSKVDAIEFCGQDVYQLSAFHKWNKSDIHLALNELNALGFVKTNICDDISLTPSGIEFMEQKPSGYFKQIVPAVRDFIEIISLFT